MTTVGRSELVNLVEAQLKADQEFQNSLAIFLTIAIKAMGGSLVITAVDMTSCDPGLLEIESTPEPYKIVIRLKEPK